MIVYRGTRNILPKHLDHRRLSSGYYGQGSYYALGLDDSRRYAQGDKFKLITTYEVNPLNSLCLDNEKVKNLKHFLPQDKFQFNETLEQELGSIHGQELCKKAIAYDSIVCRGLVEGGEQLIIPLHSSLIPEPRSFMVSIWFFSSRLGEQFCEYLKERDLSVRKEGGWYEFEVPFFESEWVSDLVEFCLDVQSPTVESVDFVNRKIQEYED